jgi:hypothetical protein
MPFELAFKKSVTIISNILDVVHRPVLYRERERENRNWGGGAVRGTTELGSEMTTFGRFPGIAR